MSKKTILWSILASVIAGSLSALAILNTQVASSSTTEIFKEVAQESPSDLHFTQHTQGASLPDLTTAAQMGVEAVVNVEILANTSSMYSSRGFGGIDPFEFFFGPQNRNSQPKQEPQQPEDKLQKIGGGSGVVISSDGYIVTNNHVIKDAEKINVTLNSGQRYEAEIIGADPSTDIALLKINTNKALKFLKFGNSDRLMLGEWVLAVGNPYGLNSTVTAGIVSAKGRSLGLNSTSAMGIESFIQTDAAVNPGNSGGALITIDGSLVGINTLIKSPTGSFTGYSFAVPASIVSKIVIDLREFGVVQRALLGISMQDISNDWIEQYGEEFDITDIGGVFIAEVAKGGAAEAGKILKGDVLIAVNDKEVNSGSEVQEIIAALRPGDKVKISIKRDGKVKHFSITLRNKSGREELLDASDVDISEILGANLQPIDNNTKQKLDISGGLQVIELKRDGILAKSNVKVGFIITSLNDIEIRNFNDLNKISEDITSIVGIYPNGMMVEYRSIAK